MLGSSLSLKRLSLKHPAAEVPSVLSSVVKWLLDNPKYGSLKPPDILLLSLYVAPIHLLSNLSDVSRLFCFTMTV